MHVAKVSLAATINGDILLEDALTGSSEVIFRRKSIPSERWKWCVIHVDNWGEKHFSLALNEESAVSIAEAMIRFSGGSAYITTREKVFGDE
tara:strand:+ start:371 stop:646 length:276 start_codon:yes stop_codon:yes gene_type:complete